MPYYFTRHSLRHPTHDYAAPGHYFVTICADGLAHVFGRIVENRMEPNAVGRIVQSAWHSLPNQFPNISLDAFVLMPNHVHGIIRIDYKGRALWEIVRAFKAKSTKLVNDLWGKRFVSIWQRSYFDRIVRDGVGLESVRRYINANPEIWDRDRNNLTMEHFRKELEEIFGGPVNPGAMNRAG